MLSILQHPAPLQDMQALPPLSTFRAGKRAARQVQGRIQLAALPCARPSPSPPSPTHRSGSDGASAIVPRANPLPKDLLCLALHPPQHGQAWPAAPQPGTGMEAALASSRGSARRGKLGSAGRWIQELAVGLMEPCQHRLEAAPS